MIALIEACKKGDVNKVKLLIAAGADVSFDNNYAIRWVSYYGHTEMAKLLIISGADVHSMNNYPIRIASSHGYTEVVELLITAGADIHAEDDESIRWASGDRQREVVKLLISASMFDEIRYSQCDNILYIYNNPNLENIDTYPIPVWCSKPSKADNDHIVQTLKSFQKKKSARS